MTSYRTDLKRMNLCYFQVAEQGKEVENENDCLEHIDIGLEGIEYVEFEVDDEDIVVGGSLVVGSLVVGTLVGGTLVGTPEQYSPLYHPLYRYSSLMSSHLNYSLNCYLGPASCDTPAPKGVQLSLVTLLLHHHFDRNQITSSNKHPNTLHWIEPTQE